MSDTLRTVICAILFGAGALLLVVHLGEQEECRKKNGIFATQFTSFTHTCIVAK